jgi:uncharacterized protein with HEPN domain
MNNSKESNLFRLGHIRDCINKVEYLSGKLHCYDNFEEQWVEQDAIIRNLEIVGEASVNVFRRLESAIPRC